MVGGTCRCPLHLSHCVDLNFETLKNRNASYFVVLSLSIHLSVDSIHFFQTNLSTVAICSFLEYQQDVTGSFGNIMADLLGFGNLCWAGIRWLKTSHEGEEVPFFCVFLRWIASGLPERLKIHENTWCIQSIHLPSNAFSETTADSTPAKVEAWILIDGTAVGVDRLFMEPVPG